MRMIVFRYAIFLLFLTVCLMRGAEEGAAARRLQKAFSNTFSARLGEMPEASDAKDPEAEASPSVPVRNLHWAPSPRWFGVSSDAWVWTFVIGAVFLVVFLADAARLMLRRYNQPEACRRRQARRTIMAFLQDQVALDEALGALKCHFEMPQGATLLQLADRIQDRHPELAEACRTLEACRFSSEDDVQAAVAFKKALRKAFAVFAVCLTGCFSGKTFSDWHHARFLADSGKPVEALEAFIELSETSQSSPELSENIASLLSVLPPDANGYAASSAQAWRLHARMQRSAVEAGVWGILPEHVLPLIAPLAVLAVLAFLHGRRRAGGVLVLACGVAIALLVTGIRSRQNLRRQVVAAPQAKILLAPDDNSLVAYELDGALPMQLVDGFGETGGYVFVRTNGAEGWIRKSSLLTFKE